MESGAVDLVDVRKVATFDSLVATAEGPPDTSKAVSWVELSTNNNYNDDDDDDNDNSVLSSVLTQVRHAYILPPVTSAHGIRGSKPSSIVVVVVVVVVEVRGRG